MASCCSKAYGFDRANALVSRCWDDLRTQGPFAIALTKDKGAGTWGDNHPQITRLDGIAPQEVEDGAKAARFEHRGNVQLLNAPGLKIKHVGALDLRVVGQAKLMNVGMNTGRQTLAEGFGDEDVGFGLIASIEGEGEIGIPPAEITEQRQESERRENREGRFRWTQLSNGLFDARFWRQGKQDEHQCNHCEVPGPDNDVVVMTE